MKQTVLAVLFASVCCVVIPINGQAASKKPKTGKAKAADSQPPKIDTVSVDTVNVTKLNIPQQPEPTGKANNDGKESKSYFYRLIAPENLPNLILCVIGIAGIISALCTLKVIREQAHWMKRQTIILADYNRATREAADSAAKSAAATQSTVGLLNKQADSMEGQLAQMKLGGQQIRQQIELAQKNVDYIANTERAWVMGEIGWYEKVGPNIEESAVRGAERTKVTMKLTCKNEGKSPAWIDHVYTRLDIVSGHALTDEIDRENLTSNGRWGALSVGESRSRSVEFYAYAVRGEGDFLSTFVVIEYRDIFDIKRETFLGYSIDPHGNIYRQDGLPNRNRNT